MNNLNKALIDIATSAFLTKGHPSFKVYRTAASFNHWQVDYLVNVTRKKRAMRTAVFGAWEETEARNYYRKKLTEYLLN